MIMLWGISEDGPLRAVRGALDAHGRDLVFVDQFDAARYECHITTTGAKEGWLDLNGFEVDLDEVGAVFLRPYATRRVLDLIEGCDNQVIEQVAWFDDALMVWTELTRALVVNRPSAMASNASKPLQTHIAKKFGFETPPTLLTNDRHAATSFQAEHGAAIYKSASGVRSRVARLDREVLARLGTCACPLQIQAWIEGVDWRVHVVGDDLFACTIESDEVDYRYPQAGSAPRMEAASLPADVAAQCLRLARGLDFALTGIDLRRTKDGRWYFLEANPSPGFTYYEDATGAPIASAVASMLAACSCPFRKFHPVDGLSRNRRIAVAAGARCAARI
jgi:glutathione synthase/RimK-type ligase-like ATP-grasp enzyme